MLKATLTFAIVLAVSASAWAQPASARVTQVAAPSNETGFVDINIGWQATKTSFDATIHPIDFVEPATVQTAYEVKAAQALDFGGGVRIGQSVAVGASFSRFSKGSDAGVDAQVPHPFFFNRLRPVNGTATDLTREETAIHVKLIYIAKPSDGWLVSVFGGPSFFKVGQDLVDDIKVDSTYPFDSATFAGVTATRHEKSVVGFNAGADITRLFTPHMGVGLTAVFARAKAKLDTGGDTTLDVDAGGLRVGGGLRFRF